MVFFSFAFCADLRGTPTKLDTQIRYRGPARILHLTKNKVLVHGQAVVKDRGVGQSGFGVDLAGEVDAHLFRLCFFLLLLLVFNFFFFFFESVTISLNSRIEHRPTM